MINIKDFSIKKKLIAIQFLTAFIVLLFYGLFIILKDLHVSKKSIISQLTSTAQLIGANSISALIFIDDEAAEEILSSLAAEEDIVNAWIYDGDGNLFAKYSKTGYSDFLYPRIGEESSTFGRTYTTLSKRIIQDNDIIGMISLRLDMKQYRAILKQNISIVLIILVVGMAFAFILSHITQRTISRPVIDLVGISRKVSETGNYSIRVEKEGNDEIGILCESFNDMMTQIQKRELERDSAEKTLKKSNEKLQKVIKERKHAEEELDRFFTLSCDMFCIAGTNGYFKRINPAFERTLGYETKELLAEPFVNFVHADDTEATLVEIQKLSDGKNTIAFENRYRCKDGSYKWLMWNSTAFPSQHLVYAAAHDITERKRAEEELAKHKEHLEELVETRTTELINANKKLQQEITERKQAEEKMKLYRRIFLNTNDGIIVMDPDGILLERNPAHQFLSGYSDEELLGKTVAPFMGDDTYQDFIRQLKENKVYRGEFVARRKDGSPIHIDLSAFPMKYDEGDPVCYVGMSRDITERKQAEEAMATRLRYEEGLAACSQTLLKETDAKEAINEVLHSLLGAAKVSRIYIFENFDDEVDGLCMRQTHEVCAEGVEPQIDDPLLQHAPYKMGFDRWRETLSKGEPIKGLLETFPSSEQDILVPQGNLSMLVIPVIVEGNWYGFIGFDDVWEKREWSDEDIRALQTASEIIGIYIERKRFEEMLRISEERFRSLVENAHDVIYSLTPQSKFSYISPKFTDIIGYKASEYINKSFYSLIHRDDIKDTMEWFRTGLKDGQKQNDYEFRLTHKDGSIRWIVGNSSVIQDENGDVMEIVGVAHDFTQMKKILEDLEEANQHLRETQVQLVQSAKMASLGNLVAGIAHEINTPIGAVNSMQDTLFRTVENLKGIIEKRFPNEYERQPKLKAVLQIMDDSKKVIKSGTERVINIVRRLRSFARLDEAELKTVNIHEGLEDTLTLIHHEVKHNITIKRDYGDVPEIACYPGKLNQVFLNILVNAKQAITENGEIKITTRTEDDKVLIAIKDSGVGIGNKHLKKVFDPGFTTKGVGVGTGLGLSICYQIIQDHRGEIKVESKVGKGTMFTIVLPMNLK